MHKENMKLNYHWNKINIKRNTYICMFAFNGREEKENNILFEY